MFFLIYLLSTYKSAQILAQIEVLCFAIHVLVLKYKSCSLLVVFFSLSLSEQLVDLSLRMISKFHNGNSIIEYLLCLYFII